MGNSKAAFITGAAAGIGRTTALTFDAKGYTVGADDIDEVGLKSLADEIDNLGARAITGHLDVTDTDEMAQRVAEFAKAAGDRLDVMINNAGILLAGPFESSANLVSDLRVRLDWPRVLAEGPARGRLAADRGVRVGLRGQYRRRARPCHRVVRHLHHQLAVTLAPCRQPGRGEAFSR